MVGGKRSGEKTKRERGGERVKEKQRECNQSLLAGRCRHRHYLSCLRDTSCILYNQKGTTPTISAVMKNVLSAGPKKTAGKMANDVR